MKAEVRRNTRIHNKLNLLYLASIKVLRNSQKNREHSHQQVLSNEISWKQFSLRWIECGIVRNTLSNVVFYLVINYIPVDEAP